MAPPTVSQEATDDLAAVERRAAVRHRCLRECLAWPEGTHGIGAWSGMVYNLSRTGIGLALPYPVGAGVTLVIERWGRSGVPTLRARVVRSAPDAFVWFHGCELVRPLNEEELRRWLK
jgi:hypothetical protein